MDETTSQIAHRIHEQRRELDENIDELQHKVKDAFDWRVHVRQRPLTMLGLAFGAGVIASFFPNGSRSRYATSTGLRPSGRVSKDWNIVQAAIGAALLAYVKDFAKEFIRGFGEEYRKRESRSASSRNANSGPVHGNSAADVEREGGITNPV
jgi:hypothetical protein